MDCLAWLRNTLLTCGKYENINYNYDSDSGPGQQLHSWSSPGERNGKLNSSVRMVSLVRMVS